MKASYLALLLVLASATEAQQYVDTAARANSRTTNDPKAVETFRDRGLGMFIHWGVDGVLGGVISHSLVGASSDFQDRFFKLLPGYFDPYRFDPDRWAALAKLAGFRICHVHRQTPCRLLHVGHRHHVLWRDAHALWKRRIARRCGCVPEAAASPSAFTSRPTISWWLHQHGITIDRHVKGVYPQDVPEFMDYTKKQLKELLTNYGPIDYFFFDGPAEQLTDYAWQLQPKLVITRGVMETPEQYTPGVALKGAWEGNLTMGTEWPWKATNEKYKSGTELIDILIETRAKGGNLLLNIGPKPDGTIPEEQDARLREIALWNFVNGEAIKDVRPWVITNEGNIWFTRNEQSHTVYAFLTKMEPWKLGDAKTITLRSLKSNPRTQISVLGQSDRNCRIPANSEAENNLGARRTGLTHHGLPGTAALHRPRMAGSRRSQN